MAKMISDDYFDDSIRVLNENGIKSDDILPITYINSDAFVKAKVAKMGGMVCTSSNAKIIIEKALKESKKIFFLPDRCLGQNIANMLGLKHKTIAIDDKLADADVICYNGFCSIHQLFTTDEIEFFRDKYDDILIISHPECDPKVCDKSDFVGSTSQIINFVNSLDIDQKIAVATEFNLVNRLREKNTYILSSTKPECPTMNETSLDDLYELLLSIKNGKPKNEILLDDDTTKWAKLALQRMFEV
jgi:quinolinate synthase